MKTLDITLALILLLSSSSLSQDTTFTEVTTINLTAVSHGTSEWGDFDNDGDLDILLTGYIVAENIAIDKIYRNDGNDTFTEYASLSTTGVYYSATAWGDYDNDGDIDILLTGNTGSEKVSKIYRNEGGTFIEQTSISLIGVDRSSVAWGDYDNDGDLDILLNGWDGIGNSVTKIYRNEGDNDFVEQTSINIIGTQKGSIAWGDYDNDGDLDILLTGHGPGVGGQLTRIYRNEGNNSFTEQTSISLTDVGASSAAWGDYDNDGDLDILLSGYALGGEVSKIYRNEGNNSFLEQTSINLIGVSNYTSKSSAWGDYDNDGDLDIIITGYNGGYNSIIYRNNADNTFTEMTSFLLTPVYDCSAAWGDYDNDGDLDLIITGSSSTSSRTTKIYRNNIEIANTIPTTPTNLNSISDTAGVTLSWNKSTDNETPQAGLKYNIVIGTNSGGMDIVSPMSDHNTGFRKVVDMGNTNHNNIWRINGLANGTYYWSVQAIDNNFAGSNFSDEQIFTVPTTVADWLNQINIVDAGGTESSEILTFGQHPDATDSIDTPLGEYELPPPPFPGIFDSRFNLPTNPVVSSIKDFRNSIQTEITWTMTFQPGSAGYPMTFSWDSLSFPEGTFYLMDRINGNYVFVNMKNQSSYSLTDTSITALNIIYRDSCSIVSVNNEWNMISVPYISEDMALNSLFPTAISLAYGYEGGYVPEDTLTVGEGYWLKFGGSEDIQICGSLLGDTVQVNEGWNMFGIYEKNIFVNEITTTPPGIIATNLFGFDNGYYIADILQTGKGYWVRVTEDGVINLNSSMLAKSGYIEQIDKLAQNWGKIRITDSEDKTITLYVAKEEIESTLYELPPKPPAGIFDARYSSGKLVEYLNNKKMIQLSSAKYPIIIKVEGLEITLRDVINGELLNKELQSGEEIIISNNKITSIEIAGSIAGEMPTSYKLYQNYPNPFNPSTTIKFALPEDSKVNLSIYNILGERAVELINKEMKAGYHQIEFNTSQLSSGVYLYIINSNNFVKCMKMILMK